MKKTLPLLLIVLMSGCAAPLPKYNYQSQVSADPEFVFGDRFGGGSVTSPARSFDINTLDPALNKCGDYSNVGTTSNHWMKVVPRTIQIKTPAGKAVGIAGGYLLNTGFSSTSCLPPLIMFTPKDGAVYSVDVEMIENRCSLSVVQKMPDGKQEPVSGITVLPACKKS